MIITFGEIVEQYQNDCTKFLLKTGNKRDIEYQTKCCKLWKKYVRKYKLHKLPNKVFEKDTIIEVEEGEE